jgi:hypothetical protein
MPSLRLPTPDGHIETYNVAGVPLAPPAPGEHRLFNRVAYAAAHVVADPFADNDPWLDSDIQSIDWERTIAFRHHLWDLGLGVAEAMDTAQRGMGLSLAGAQQLIRLSLEASRSRPDALIACGVGTDHLTAGADITVDEVIRAYEEQMEFVESLGGRIILMASRALVAAARSPDDYLHVYDRILRQASQPVILHWLGEMFDPALAGYWGSADHAAAMDTCVDLINSHAGKAPGVRMYTGDDFNYPELIAGDEQGYSHALLGIFDAIAPAASAAMASLGAGDLAAFHAILAPTVPLSRHIFRAPTRFYKTGIVFLAYLNGFQDHFVMLGGQQSARSLVHLAELFRLADAASMLRDPDLAAVRMKRILAVGGIV